MDNSAINDKQISNKYLVTPKIKKIDPFLD